MSIANFVSKLLPRIDRKNVAEDIRLTSAELAESVIPSIEASAAFFKVVRTASKEVRALEADFYSYFDRHGASKKGNMFLELQDAFANVQLNLQSIKGFVETEIDKDILPVGMTARKIVILRGASHISFLSRYTMALLNYVYAKETEANNTDHDDELKITKAELAYVEKFFPQAIRLLSIYGVPNKKFVDLVKATPEIYVNAKTADAVAGIYSKNEYDFIPADLVSGFIGNPIYRIRLVIAEWQNARYESMKNKKQQLELRLLNLEMYKDGKNDPQLAKEIGRLQSRIENYDADLRETEEKLGLGDL